MINDFGSSKIKGDISVLNERDIIVKFLQMEILFVKLCLIEPVLYRDVIEKNNNQVEETEHFRE